MIEIIDVYALSASEKEALLQHESIHLTGIPKPIYDKFKKLCKLRDHSVRRVLMNAMLEYATKKCLNDNLPGSDLKLALNFATRIKEEFRHVRALDRRDRTYWPLTRTGKPSSMKKREPAKPRVILLAPKPKKVLTDEQIAIKTGMIPLQPKGRTASLFSGR